MLVAENFLLKQGLPVQRMDRAPDVTIKRLLKTWSLQMKLNFLFNTVSERWGLFDTKKAQKAVLQGIGFDKILGHAIDTKGVIYPEGNMQIVIMHERDLLFIEALKQAKAQEGDTILAIVGAAHLYGIVDFWHIKVPWVGELRTPDFSLETPAGTTETEMPKAWTGVAELWSSPTKIFSDLWLYCKKLWRKDSAAQKKAQDVINAAVEQS